MKNTVQYRLKILTLLLPLAASAAWAQTSPSNWLDFSLNSEKIKTACGKLKMDTGTRLSVLAAVPKEKRSFQNTALAFEEAMADFNDGSASPTFPKYVSTDKAVRDAAHECETETEQYLVDVYTREDLYRAMVEISEKREALDAANQRLLNRILLDFKRNGLALDPQKRAQVKKLKEKLVGIEAEFGKNLNEYKDHLDVSREELEGLGEDYVAKLSTAPEGKYQVTLAYPDYFPFMENAKNAQTRQQLEYKFNNRASPVNTSLLEEAIQIRHELGGLLGYQTHAHYVLEDRMAKTPEAVGQFLDSLQTKLRVLADQELKVLKSLKKKERRAEPEKMRVWEWRYYDNLLKKTKYRIDDQKIKEYFPLDVVTAGMLRVYQQLLGLEFREIKPAYAWHPDVQEFEVLDKETAKTVGFFYMDLFPREGKYNHAAAFSLVKGRRMADGSYQKPVSAIVANFNKPSADRPSLMQHSEVETYFHEFGHIMHQTLTQASYSRFSGTSVSQDFVEAPSQMLENWVWNEEILKSLSGHYKDKSKKLPPDLLKRMVEAKNMNAGLRYLRQVFFAKLDLAYHTTDKIDTTSVYQDLMQAISLIPMSEGTHPQASFGHLMGGYDAGYYGYLWSEVYSADMFARFEKEGLLNPKTGLDYRRMILEPGRSRDEMDSLKLFLGRDPNDAAFLKSIGLK